MNGQEKMITEDEAITPGRPMMNRKRSILALSAALLAAGVASPGARADDSAAGRDNRPAAVRKDSDEERVPRLSAQPLAAKLATASAGGAAGGTSTSTYITTFMNGMATDAQTDVDSGF